jgi:tetratricopeptide (TPR) repeat protein
MLKRTQTAIEQTLQTNLSAEVQANLGKIAFQARDALAQLYLQPSVARAAEVMPLLADVETKYPNDQAKLAQTWTLRIRSLQAQGQLDEAVRLLESLRQKNPDSAGVAVAAGVVADALDNAGAALIDKDPSSAEGEKKWRDAAQYYMLSLRPWLGDSTMPPNERINSIANRMLNTFGTHFNHVPEQYTSFVGFTEKPPAEPYFFEQAETIYRAMLERAPSSKVSMSLGRTLGYLARWREAADIYAREMDKEQLFDAGGTRFTSAIKSTKPELIYGYLEWGVAERNAAVAENKTDAASLKRASTIFERMVSNTSGEKETKLYWQSKYYQIRCWMDQGKYDVADVAVAQEERTTDDFDGGKFGYKEKFQQLKAELSKKVFKNK